MNYIQPLTILGIAILLLLTLIIQIPEYDPIQPENTVSFSGTINKISQSNKTSLLLINSQCQIPVRIFHAQPYNFTKNQTVSGFGELSENKEIIAQKLIAQTLTIR